MLLLEKKQAKKINKLGLNPLEFMRSMQDLREKYTRFLAGDLLDFTDYHQRLKNIFDDLETQKTRENFTEAFKAQKQKQMKGLQKLEKKMLRAEQKRHQAILQTISEIHRQLFPSHQMQERVANFTTYFAQYGEAFLDRLKKNITPFGEQVHCCVLEDEV